MPARAPVARRRRLTRRIVERWESDASAVGCSFKVDAVRTLGSWDEPRLEQVLSGLLANAIKYAPGTEVEVEVEEHLEYARLLVRDHGRGIPDEARARVFDRFERAVSVDNYGGFGLGLYMSRKIVEAHGGAIDAEPTQGGGTTVVVSLPKLPRAAGERSP